MVPRHIEDGPSIRFVPPGASRSVWGTPMPNAMWTPRHRRGQEDHLVTVSPDSSRTPLAIRVMVSDLPDGLRRHVEQVIASQPDMTLVATAGRVVERMDLLVGVQHGVDVLVLGAPAAMPPPNICSHLLGEFPDLKILVIGEHDGAVMYWLGLRHRRLRRISPRALLLSIRRAHAQNVLAGSAASS
jgi:hypothetical protein